MIRLSVVFGDAKHLKEEIGKLKQEIEEVKKRQDEQEKHMDAITKKVWLRNEE